MLSLPYVIRGRIRMISLIISSNITVVLAAHQITEYCFALNYSAEAYFNRQKQHSWHCHSPDVEYWIHPNDDSPNDYRTKFLYLVKKYFIYSKLLAYFIISSLFDCIFKINSKRAMF